MAMTIDTRFKLNNGVEIPCLGLGVFLAPKGEETYNAVRWALEAGYRHVDTAAVYGNEADVGRALADSRIPREQVFLTTKVWNSEQGYDTTPAACDTSLRKLATDYVDLYLIHWPVAGKRLDTWRALIDLRERGKCRAIGVSNFMVPHLKGLLAASSVVPAVNQIEFNCFLYEQAELELCREHGIQVEAYSPMARARKLDDPRLDAVATRHGKSPAQVMIRWGLQHGVVVIPKSVHKDRIRQNADVFDFELSGEDMAELDGLNEGFRTLPPDWNPHDWP